MEKVSMFIYNLGVMKYKDGSVYKGQWKKGKKHGNGTFQLEGGGIYDGDFIDGVACGYGLFTDSKGNKYEGQWKDDLYHGDGKEFWTDGIFTLKLKD